MNGAPATLQVNLDRVLDHNTGTQTLAHKNSEKKSGHNYPKSLCLTSVGGGTSSFVSSGALMDIIV